MVAMCRTSDFCRCDAGFVVRSPKALKPTIGKPILAAPQVAPDPRPASHLIAYRTWPLYDPLQRTGELPLAREQANWRRSLPQTLSATPV
jgi:hypothetical protein